MALDPALGDVGADKEFSLRQSLFVEEYRSLREESKQALNAQQSSLQWSLGALAVIFGAALAFGGRSQAPAGQGVSDVSHSFAFYLAFGFAVPGLVIGAAMVWMGELFKMERVGCYLRAREKAVWVKSDIPGSPSLDAVRRPILWESYLVGPNARFRTPRGTLGNSPIAFIGGAVIYGGGLTMGLTLAFSGLVSDVFIAGSFYDRNIGALRVAFGVYAGVLIVGVATWMIVCALQLIYLSQRAADLSGVREAPSADEWFGSTHTERN